MSGSFHERSKRLYLEVCERPTSERLVYLHSICDDEALRREVESLLGHSAPGLDLPMAQMPPRDVIDGYRLLEPIGEGGMGEVWKAQQLEPVRREVAIKLIRWGMDSRQVAARFDSERQALAMMSHPNIARVFDAGSTRQGRPFFAMELVDGVAITEFCDRERLGTEERLRLFADVCAGVQHAHRKGVIHRDLKPSNVLVVEQDGRAVPKIIDFGVAKATEQRLTEETVFTELGQWIGTPEYMSPEQAELDNSEIDTRTDVYSLGVLLYELLVGRRPFDSSELRRGGFDEMRRRIREEDPARPSTRVSTLGDDSRELALRRGTEPQALARRLRGDLDWITMRALAKERGRRYDSPSELADDLRRHLDDHPVEAGPPGRGYRVRKFVSRHRFGTAAAALTLGALLLGVVGTSYGLVRARQEASAARQVAETLEELLAQLNPSETRAQHITSSALLDHGAGMVAGKLHDQPLVRARLMTTMGGTNNLLGNYAAAREQLDSALALRREHLGETSPEYADSLAARSFLSYTVGDWTAALAGFEEVLAIRQAAHGPDHESVARSHHDLGFIHWKLGNYDAAAAAFGSALPLKERIWGPDHPQTAYTLGVQGLLALEVGGYETAISRLTRSLQIRERAQGPDHPDTGWALNDLGLALIAVGRHEEALSRFQRSLDVQEAVFGPDHPAVAFPLSHIAWMETLMSRPELARPKLERSLAIRTAAFGDSHVEVFYSVRGLAGLEESLLNFETTLELRRRALEIAREVFPPGHKEIGESYGGLGFALKRLLRYEEALEPTRRSLEILESALGPDHPWVANPLMNLGSLLRDMGRLEEARPLIERGFALRRSAHGDDHPLVADDFHTLAKLNHLEGNWDEADRYYRLALAATERTLGADHYWMERNRRDHEALLADAGSRLTNRNESRGRDTSDAAQPAEEGDSDSR